MSVDYDKIKVNDEEQDVFVAAKDVFNVENGGNRIEVTLTSPFAQLNWGSSDLFEDCIKDDLEDYKVKVNLSGCQICDSYNLITGVMNVVSKDSSLDLDSFTLGNYSKDADFPVSDDYTLIAMHYLLIDNNASTTGTVKLEIKNALTEIAISVSNAPLQNNCRTNIYGALVSSPGEFSVDYENSFNGDSSYGNPNISVGD